MSLGDSKEPGPCLLETVFIEGNAIPRSLGACLLDASANRFMLIPRSLGTCLLDASANRLMLFPRSLGQLISRSITMWTRLCYCAKRLQGLSVRVNFCLLLLLSMLFLPAAAVDARA